MEDQQVYQKVHDGVCREEPTFIRALQGHSGKNLVFSMHSHNKRLSNAPLLYHFGSSRYDDSSGERVPGFFWTNQRQKSRINLTRVAIESKPRPEVQAIPPLEEPS